MYQISVDGSVGLKVPHCRADLNGHDLYLLQGGEGRGGEGRGGEGRGGEGRGGEGRGGEGRGGEGRGGEGRGGEERVEAFKLLSNYYKAEYRGSGPYPIIDERYYMHYKKKPTRVSTTHITHKSRAERTPYTFINKLHFNVTGHCGASLVECMR